MGHGTIVLCLPGKPGEREREKKRNADTLNESICVCTELWTFHALGFMHWCV